MESSAELTGSPTRSSSATGLEKTCLDSDFCGVDFCSRIVNAIAGGISIPNQRLSLLKEQYERRLYKSYSPNGLRFYFLLSNGRIVTNQEGVKSSQTHVYSVLLLLLKLGSPSTIAGLILDLHDLIDLKLSAGSLNSSSSSTSTSSSSLLSSSSSSSSSTPTFSSLIIALYSSLSPSDANVRIVKKLLVILLCLGQALFESHGTIFVAACLTYEPILVLRVVHGFLFATEAIIKDVVTVARRLSSNSSDADRRDLSQLINVNLNDLDCLKKLQGCDLMSCGARYRFSSMDTLIKLIDAELKHPYFENTRYLQLKDKPSNTRLDTCNDFLLRLTDSSFAQKREDFEKPMSEGKLIFGCHHCLYSNKPESEYCRSIAVASLGEIERLKIPTYCYNVNTGCGINAYYKLYLNHPHKDPAFQLRDPQAWIENLLETNKFGWEEKEARTGSLEFTHLSEHTKNDTVLGYGEYYAHTSEKRFGWGQNSTQSENLLLMLNQQNLLGKCLFDLSRVKVNGQEIGDYLGWGTYGKPRWGLVKKKPAEDTVSSLADTSILESTELVQKKRPGKRSGGGRFTKEELEIGKITHDQFNAQTAEPFENVFFEQKFPHLSKSRAKSLVTHIKKDEKIFNSASIAAGSGKVNKGDGEDLQEDDEILLESNQPVKKYPSHKKMKTSTESFLAAEIVENRVKREESSSSPAAAPSSSSSSSSSSSTSKRGREDSTKGTTSPTASLQPSSIAATAVGSSSKRRRENSSSSVPTAFVQPLTNDATAVGSFSTSSAVAVSSSSSSAAVSLSSTYAVSSSSAAASSFSSAPAITDISPVSSVDGVSRCTYCKNTNVAGSCVECGETLCLSYRCSITCQCSVLLCNDCTRDNVWQYCVQCHMMLCDDCNEEHNHPPTPPSPPPLLPQQQLAQPLARHISPPRHVEIVIPDDEINRELDRLRR